MICLSKGDWNTILDNVIEELTGSKKTVTVIQNTNIQTSNKSSVSFVSKPGIYAIWVNGMCKYVGETNDFSRRFAEHLFGPAATGNQYQKVLASANNGYTIGVSYVEIEPPPMRLAIEDELIYKLTKSNYPLPWNKKSVSKSGLEQWVLDFLNSTSSVSKTAWALELQSAYIIDFGLNNRLDSVLKSMVLKKLIKRKRKVVSHKYEYFYSL